jgi:hypothetical protein
LKTGRRQWLRMVLALFAAASVRSSGADRPDGSVDPREFGAVGNGSKVDSSAFQKCIDSGKTVWVSNGRYLVGNLRLRTGSRIIGAGDGSRLIQATSAKYLMSINPGTEGTSSAEDNIRSVVLKGLVLNGQVVATGFREHSHVLNFNACSDVLVESCDIVGFRGDGIYLGSGNSGRDERHNHRVTIKNCRFDGITRNNRNAVSVVDCDGLLVEGCGFRNCTRPDMPGAVDIEPDPAPHHVVQNIRIANNAFEGIGGNLGVVSLLAAHKKYVSPPKNITIDHNVIDGGDKANGIVLISRGDWRSDAPDMEIKVEGNTIINSASPFELSGVGGVTFRGNKVVRAREAAEIAFPRNGRTGRVLLIGNDFESLSLRDSRGIRVQAGGPITISGNRFVGWGSKTISVQVALDLTRAIRDLVSVHDNSFIDDQSWGRAAIAAPLDTEAEFDVSSNRFSEGLVRLR